MKASVKKKWVAALRSGKYQQGFSSLKRDDGSYCCLGVLCSISGKPYRGSDLVIPDSVKRWAGLEDPDPFIESETSHVTGLNDNRQLSFSRIADIIEAQL